MDRFEIVAAPAAVVTDAETVPHLRIEAGTARRPVTLHIYGELEDLSDLGAAITDAVMAVRRRRLEREMNILAVIG